MLRTVKYASLTVLTVLIIIVIIPDSFAQEKLVMWVDVEGYISPATANHVQEALEELEREHYVPVIIALDTFGGLADSTFKIIESIQTSPVPIIGYVYPAGRQAVSAGTIILLASDYAVMAPFTTIGSAQPVFGTEPIEESKVVNALVEKARALARIHNRNETQAARFITHNDNLQPEEALTRGIIEGSYWIPEELLAGSDGALVYTINGDTILDTKDARIVTFEPSVRVSILKILSDPIISSLLISVGFLIYKAAKVMRSKKVLQPYPIGQGRAMDDLSPDSMGFVVIDGEYWKAKSPKPVPSGTRVKVIGEHDGILSVESLK